MASSSKLNAVPEDEVTDVEASSERPIDLLDVCRRVISEWQYLDNTVKQSRLRKVERDVPLYNVTHLSSKTGNQLVIPKSEENILKCTKLTIYDNYTLHERRDVRNLKNFLDESYELNLDELETFYWLLRLRCRSSILPIVLINIIPKLKRIGYTGWKLPTDEVIPFSELRTGNLDICPRHLYIYQNIQLIGAYTHEDKTYPYQCKDYEFGMGPILHHCVLITTLASGKIYVVDPTSMQYNMKGPASTLIWHGEWDDYEEEFPGKIINASFDDWKDVFDEQLDSANNPRGLVKKLEERIIRHIDRKCCDRCGEFDGTRNEFPIPAMFYRSSITSLRPCPKCNKGLYCDDDCQACDAIYHNSVCIASEDSTEVDG